MVPKTSRITSFLEYFRRQATGTPFRATPTQLLLYVANFVKDPKTIQKELEDIGRLETLSWEEQDAAAANVYRRLEARLCPAVFPIDKLRETVGARFGRRLRMHFTTMFLPETDQEVGRLELAADDAVRRMLPSFGRPYVEKLISAKTYSTILNGTMLNASNHLDFSAAESRFLKLPPPWLKLVEKSLATFTDDLDSLLAQKRKSLIPLTPVALAMLQSLGMSHLSDEGSVVDLEQGLITKKGSVVPVVLTASALRGLDGAVLGAVISAKDISKIRQLEEEKRAAALNLFRRVELEKNKLASTLESIGDGAFVVDRQGQITFFNPVAEAISGYTAQEAVGKPFRQILKLLQESDRTENYSLIEGALSKGEIGHTTNPKLLISKSGAEVSVAESVSPIKTAEGEVTGCVVIVRDVTRERTDEKMKAEFVSLASHQLRTPLAGMRWVSEVLLEEGGKGLSKEKRGLLVDLNATAVRMTGVVNAILNIARLDGGGLVIRSEPVDSKAVIETVLGTLQPMINDKKLRVTTHVDAIPPITTDARLVTEVLTNLVSNAVRYTAPAGRVEINVSMKKPDIVFSVKDDGYGILQSQQHLAFQKFFRGDNIVKIATEGTGLGLYIVHKLVGLLGGKTWFESKENQGTTFFFTIPLAGTEPRASKKPLT